MDFRVLGALEVVDDGGQISLGGPKQRAVLAHLIIRSNQAVAVDLLIDALWGEDPRKRRGARSRPMYPASGGHSGNGGSRDAVADTS